MAGYYIISVNCGTRPVPNDAIQNVLNAQEDWLRFGGDTYYVFSRVMTARQLYDQIKPVLHGDDFILVSNANVADLYGWGTQMVVDWFAKSRP